MKDFSSTLNRQTKVGDTISTEKENTEKAASEYLRMNRKFESQLSELKLENRTLNAKLEEELEINQQYIKENMILKKNSDQLEKKVNELEFELKSLQKDISDAELIQLKKENELKHT